MKATEIIKAHEGLELRAYRCPAGVWTIGWGHTEGVSEGDEITYREAEALLEADAGAIETRIRSGAADAGIELVERQIAALTSLAYNIGVGAFMKSTLWRRVRANPADPRIRNEFMRWKYGGGKILPGLVNRRIHEAALYFGF